MTSGVDLVRRMLIDDLGFVGDPSDLSEDRDLIEDAIVDSLGIVRLVQLLEDRHGVEIADEDLEPETFSTVAAIARLLP